MNSTFMVNSRASIFCVCPPLSETVCERNLVYCSTNAQAPSIIFLTLMEKKQPTAGFSRFLKSVYGQDLVYCRIRPAYVYYV